jgi:benzodiazapine receptor
MNLWKITYLFINNINMNLWYKNLNKSPLSPPDYVFSLVWLILYVLIIISFILNINNKNALIFFILQLFFNLIWTYIFFNLKNPELSLLDLLLVIIFSILYFININQTGKYLIIPYILWLLFAFYLNLYVVIYN